MRRFGALSEESGPRLIPVGRRSALAGAMMGAEKGLGVAWGLALVLVAVLGAGLACSGATTLSTVVVLQTTAVILDTTTTSSTQSTAAFVNRHDPESVLRVKASAWQAAAMTGPMT
jgi:hypothetical protein